MAEHRTRLHSFEFDVYRRLEKHRGEFSGEKWLVAVSGGLDSIVLLAVLAKIQLRLGVKLAVGHVHHGESPDPEVMKARDGARALVLRVAKARGFDSFDHRSTTSLSSEDDLRRFRHRELEVIRRASGCSRVVFAHHSDDLVETRLIRLIRGTGPAGLKAMRLKAGTRLRPFLGVTRARIEAYAKEHSISYFEDPSNASREPLRNWVRHEWLPELEAKRKGAKEALGRSLQLLAETVSGGDAARGFLSLAESCLNEGGIDRLLFSPLREREKRFVLALYMRRMNARGIGRSQIEEVIKRLDTPRNDIKFRVGTYLWHINAEQIRAEFTELEKR